MDPAWQVAIARGEKIGPNALNDFVNPWVKVGISDLIV